MGTTLMIIDQKARGDVVVLSLKGSLTSEIETSQLRDVVSKLVQKNVRKVVVDIRKVDRISSLGLGAIMSAMTSLRTRKGELCVANPTEKTGPLFRVTKVVKVLKLYETVGKAVENLK
jgi:anti-sigma B factor antagonist